MPRLVIVIAVGGVAVLAWLLLLRAEEGARADRSVGQGAPRSAEREPAQSSANTLASGHTAESTPTEDRIVPGIVVDPSGWPVRGALVLVAAYPNGVVDPNPAGTGTTDAEGRFAVRDVVVGGKTRYCSIHHAAFHPIEYERVELGSDLRFVLNPGLQVRGHVRFPDGRPAPGVPVDKDPWTVYTDDNGSFAFGGLKPGPVVLECRTVVSRIFEETVVDESGAEAIDQAEDMKPDVFEVEAGRTDVEIVLQDSVLVIRVLDEEGREVTGARCRFGNGDSTQPGRMDRPYYSRIVSTGASGQVIVHRRGSLPARVDYGPVPDAPQLIEHVAVLRKAPDNSIELRIRTASGKPLPKPAPRVDVLDADGIVLRREIAALRDSRATVGSLPAGAVRLRVSWQTPKLAATRTVEIHPGHENMAEFTIPASGELKVLWRAATAGRSIEVYGHQDRTPVATMYSIDRAWVLEYPLKVGTYLVHGREGGFVVRKGTVEIKAGEPATVDWRER